MTEEPDFPLDIYAPSRLPHEHSDACVNRVHGPDGQWPWGPKPFHELAMLGHIEVEREIPIITRNVVIAMTRECREFIAGRREPDDVVWRRFVELTESWTVVVESFGDLDAYPSFGLAMTDDILPMLLAEAREQVTSEGEGSP